MAFEIIIKQSAMKSIKKMERTMRANIWLAVSNLAENPRPHGCVKLKGEAGLWRIRVGEYRVVYQVREKELVVLIIRVGHRRDVYRLK